METVGNLIDKLSIVNIRIWFAEDIKRNKDATDKQLADACRVTNIANSQRNDLIQEIDEMLNKMVATGELQKLYKQGSTKMYGRDAAGTVAAETGAAADAETVDPGGCADAC